MSATPVRDLSGTILGGRYRLVRQLGRGGMGAVYEAVQQDLGRPVAVKVIVPDLAEEPEVMARFRREAEAAASLRHPNIVQVTDFRHQPPEPAFLVMEMLQGRSLKDLAKPFVELDEALVRSVALQVLGALDVAHRAGIVHRDLKPDNIFLVDVPGVGPVVKLLDFGIAKLTESRGYARLTATGVLVGTPAYMASEQLSGRPVDARTDLYALGATMFRMLTGKLPYQGLDLAAKLRAMMQLPPPRVIDERPDVDPALDAIVARAMAPDPAARFGSAAEMGTALSSAHATPRASTGALTEASMPAAAVTIANHAAQQVHIAPLAPRTSMPAVMSSPAAAPGSFPAMVPAVAQPVPTATARSNGIAYALGGVLAGAVIAGGVAIAVVARRAPATASSPAQAAVAGAPDVFANARVVQSERLEIAANPPQPIGQGIPPNAGPVGESLAQSILGCYEAHDLVPTRPSVAMLSILVFSFESTPRITVAETEMNQARLDCLRTAASGVQFLLQPGTQSVGASYSFRLRSR